MSLARFAVIVLREGDIAFDIGANKGSTALLLSRCVGKAGHVYAFDPNRTCFAKLEQAAASAWHRNIRPYPLALSDIHGTLRLLIDMREGSLASTTVVDHAHREEKMHGAIYDHTSVDAPTLDEFCVRYDVVPTFLTVDVEGAEAAVMRGGKKLISTHLPLIWFVCWYWLEGGAPRNQTLCHKE